MHSSELEKKSRRKRRTLNSELDEDDLGLHEDLAGHDVDGKRAGKRKHKDGHKHIRDPIPSNLYKQMQTILDCVIKYRDECVTVFRDRLFERIVSSLVRIAEC